MIGLFDQMNRFLMRRNQISSPTKFNMKYIQGNPLLQFNSKSHSSAKQQIEKESVYLSMESFPSDINPSVYSVEWSKLFVDCIYGSQPAIYGPPAGHNWSNSNLLTSINRAITFYGARSSNFLSTCIDHRKKQVKKARGSGDAISGRLSLISGHTKMGLK